MKVEEGVTKMNDREKRLRARSRRSEEYLSNIPLNRLGPAGRILAASPRPPGKRERQRSTAEYDGEQKTRQLQFGDY